MRPNRIAPLLALLSMFLAGCAQGPAPRSPDAMPAPGASETAPAFGEARLLFEPPAPWYVEGVTAWEDRLFTGTALGSMGSYLPLETRGEPSRIYVVNATSGEILDPILVEGEDTSAVHGITGLEMDGAGRLYAASTQLGVLRFTPSADGWKQETYATIPNIPLCLPILAPPCSPTPDDEPAFPNDLTWDAAGNLYVSDSWQATIWRVPPGPGKPEIWYQHASLDRAFGPNGLLVSPAGDQMVLAVCCVDTINTPLVDRASRIVTLPFPDPGTAAPTDFARLANGEGADGIAWGEKGELYVASNMGNKILVYAPDGSLARTIAAADLTGEGTFDFPASLAFRGRSLVVANYAWSDAGPSREGGGLVEVFVDDAGTPEPRPVVP